MNGRLGLVLVFVGFAFAVSAPAAGAEVTITFDVDGLEPGNYELTVDKFTGVQHSLWVMTSPRFVIDELVVSGSVSARQLARFAAETFGHPMLDITAIDLAVIPQDLIDRKLAAETRVRARGKRVTRI